MPRKRPWPRSRTCHQRARHLALLPFLVRPASGAPPPARGAPLQEREALTPTPPPLRRANTRITKGYLNPNPSLIATGEGRFHRREGATAGVFSAAIDRTYDAASAFAIASSKSFGWRNCTCTPFTKKVGVP